jgi:ABC-type branched-subunit amino acid transport system ATPase component
MENNKVFWTQDLSISFGGLVAVDQVNMDISRGEILGLIGPNGSGKTTVFNLVTGIYTPTAGEFFFEGESLLGQPPHEIARKGIARTFQISRLCLDLSVLDNVFIGMHERQKHWLVDSVFRRRLLAEEVSEGREKALSLLSVFNEDLVDVAGKPAGTLPQIDRRRVEICRAMAMEPKLLLLDEPSAGMNPEEMAELMGDIKKVQEESEGISIIIVEHDMTVIRSISDRVVALNYGRKIAEGSFEEVSQNAEVREAYLGKRGDRI